MGILTAMTLIMFAAKVFGFITWSWWVVMSPLIFETGLILVLSTVAVTAKRRFLR